LLGILGNNNAQKNLAKAINFNKVLSSPINKWFGAGTNNRQKHKSPNLKLGLLTIVYQLTTKSRKA
jgi:hypothetical protein